MSLLARALAKARAAGQVATATTASIATAEAQPAQAVAVAAVVAVAGGGALRYTWPHGVAANPLELERMAKRLALLAARGLSIDAAERMADALMNRDRDGDTRRVCLECRQLVQGDTLQFCSAHARADLPSRTLARGLPVMLQRCPGFAEV